MIVLGVIIIIGGIILSLYGNNMNNDIGSQLSSLFGSGRTNPGDTYLYIGVVLAVVGIIMVVYGVYQNSKSKK